MRCPSCGFENPLEIKFCGECGAPLKNICPNCGFKNPPGFKFCGECATPLIDQAPASKSTDIDRQPYKQEDKGAQIIPIMSEPKAPEAERRQVTVMFCDMVGSSTLSEQLDPEELREVMCDYLETFAEVIGHYEGYIAKYLGDGILVYFGYPQAHEDDAQRAVRTGLKIVGAVRELPLHTRLQQPLQVRLGIHTGLVVAGEIGSGDQREVTAIVGETPNIAARLQGLAEPNTVVISDATYRLIRGYFTFQDLGSPTLKGITRPVRVYQVLQENEAQSRFEVAITTGLTSLVGREQEIELLLERWERVKEGEGQVVFLIGEAGIGKSRLVQVLKEHVAGESHTRIESLCSPYYQNSSLYPVIDHLQRLLEFRREDSPQEKLNKLEKALVGAQHAVPLQEMVPLFASLLSLPLPESYPSLTLTPQRQKQKTLEALLTWLLKEAEKHPVLRIVEDLHWVDPSTLEYLSLLVEQVPKTRIFALFTFRPDFSPPWGARSHLTQITLNHLTWKQVEVMVEREAGGKALPAEVVQQVVAKTDGVPLFVEELTKMVLESELLREQEDHYELTGPVPPLAIPATLQDSLMARLDRLATVKEVAQLGATLGREFTYELLKAVSPLDETTLQRELAKLVKAELLYQRGIPPNARYFFKHALIQEAAYQTLLKSKRRQYHQKIAQVLEERFAEIRETQPELLAYHYTEAGLSGQAIVYWHRASQRAIERSANIEAIGHLIKGLESLKALPDTPERIQQELTLQIILGVPLTATKGYAAPEVEQTYARARELCQQIGETSQLFPVLRGLAQFYRVRAELTTAREHAEELLTVAQNLQNSSFLLEAHLALGEILFWLGDLSAALEHVKQGFALYSPQEHRWQDFLYIQDPGMACCGYEAWTLWFLGYPDQALERSKEALALAQELSHPYTLAIALLFNACLHQFRRESKLTQERANTLIDLSNEQGFPQWLAWGTILRGWALCDQGMLREEVESIKRGLSARKAQGSEIAGTYFLALLAEGYGKVGQTKEGITVLTEALDTAQKTGECFYESELHRLYGELLLRTSFENQTVRPFDRAQDSVQAEAEDNFLKAINIARRQGAKSLELRAVISLCRLMQKQDKREEARKTLAAIYSWFTEGFETTNLKEAKSLLENLS